jgi:hypothetical protein
MGAVPQEARHSTSWSVNIPSGVVSPGSIPSRSRRWSTIRRAPISSHDSVRHTWSFHFPTGLSSNMV